MECIKNRLNYLDSTKGFVILLVIIGHIYNSDTVIKTWIYSFHMPLFFIISGFFASNKKISLAEMVIKRFKTLIIPYIFFSGVMISLKLLINGGLTGEIKTYILYFITCTGYDALWFLPCLFIIEIIYITLNNISSKSVIKLLITAILFIIGLYGCDLYSNIVMITLYRSFIGFGFFMFGDYTFKYVKCMKLSYITIIIMFMSTILLSMYNGCVDLWGLRFYNKLTYVVCSIIGSYAVILLLKNISETFNIKILQYFGINSLIVMSTHQIILEFTSKTLNIDYSNFLVGIIIFLVITSIEIPIIHLINNYTPWMLGRFKKKEKQQLAID